MATSDPLVTCIMPTRDRRRFVARAIDYFRRQDYTQRELIIVDDGDDPVAELAAGDPRIRYIRLDHHLTIGAKRNLACDAARGDIILHWDDDDWIADWRIGYQVTHLLRRQADICGLSSLFYYDLTSGEGWHYVYRQRHDQPWVAGCTLCYTKSSWQTNPFLNLSVGEDAHFVWNRHPSRVIVPPRSDFYVAFIHGGNVAPKQPDTNWHLYPAHRLQRLIGADWPYYSGPLSPTVAQREQLLPRNETVSLSRREIRTTPEIAVIVTCHEPHLKWLPQALVSINKQSPLPVERLVVFDRCKCPEQLVDGWGAFEGDWGHPAGARNAGIASTNAPWIIFWDADNIMPEGYVMAMQQAINAASHDVAIIYPDIQYCDENLNLEHLWKTPEWNYWELRAANYIDTASAWRREALEIIGGWSDRTILLEDFSLALDVTAAGWKAGKIHGPPVLMRVHKQSRTQRGLAAGDLGGDIWKARSLAIVSLLAGRQTVFQSWANFLLNSELPPKTALYVIENSGNPDFNRLAMETCQQIARIRGLSHVQVATVNQTYHSTNSEPYFTKHRHLHVARLYASIFPHITEDLILTLEDDVEPPLDAVRKLGEHFGWASSREKVGVVAAAYSMPQDEAYVCAGRGLEEWGDAIRWQDLPEGSIDMGCVGGGCTIWANWALNGFPVNFWWQRGLGWDAALSIQLRHRGYQIKLHGGVRCKHHLHGRVNGNPNFWIPMQLSSGPQDLSMQQINQNADSWIHPADIGTHFPPYKPTFGFESFINERHRILSECSVKDDSTIDIGIAGWLRKEDALKLYELAYFVTGNVLEIGCYQGLSTSILAQAVKDSRDPKSIVSIDIEASHLASAERQLISRGLKPHVNFICSDAVTGCQDLIRQHRRFGLIFVDHSHRYQDIVEICQLIPDLILSGGFCIFHDFNDQRNNDPNNPDYGVSQAVYDRLNIELFEFYGIFGCVAMYRKR